MVLTDPLDGAGKILSGSGIGYGFHMDSIAYRSAGCKGFLPDRTVLFGGAGFRVRCKNRLCDLRSVLVWGADECRGSFGNTLAQFGDLFLAQLWRIVHREFGNESYP